MNTQRIERFGPYLLFRRAGRGAMGRVDVVVRRRRAGAPLYALKRLPSERSEMQEARFEREARIALSFDHPSIARTFSVEKIKGELCLVQEFVHGADLSWITSKLDGPCPSGIATLIALRVAQALDYAHSQGVVHRDVAPNNILLGYDGTVKLIDFGAAKNLHASPDRAATAAGLAVGRRHYTAPEVANGDPASPSSDVFSLGVVIWQLLTGVPFPQPLERGLRQIPQPPSRANPTVPAALDDVILKAVSYDPMIRFRSAAELAEALEPFVGTPYPEVIAHFLVEQVHVDVDKERSWLDGDVRDALASAPQSRRWWLPAVAGLLMAAAVAALIAHVRRPEAPSPAPAQAASPAATASPRPPSGPPPPAAPTFIPELVATPEPAAVERTKVVRRPPRKRTALPVPQESPESLMERAGDALDRRAYDVAEALAEKATRSGGGQRAEALLARIRAERGTP